MKEGDPKPSFFLKKKGEIMQRVGNGIKLEIEGSEAIEKAKRQLEQGSLLIYYNHTSIADAYLLVRLIRDKFGLNYLPQTYALTSQKHLDSDRSLSSRFQSGVMESISLVDKINLIPIVQEYDRQNYPNYTGANSSSLRATLEILSIPGNVVLIAPEETRSRDKKLLEGKEGLSMLFSVSRYKTLALPVGITWISDFQKNGSPLVNLKSQSKIVIGNPIGYNESTSGLLIPENLDRKSRRNLEYQLITENLMRRLATLLPEENRGYYK